MTIHIAADHAGFELKEKLKAFLTEKGYEVKDYGAFSYDAADDYPDFMRPVAEAIGKNPEEDKGFVLGGSGQGEAMVCNRVPKVRAAVYYGGPRDIITLSRVHNNANVLALGARFLTVEEVTSVALLWLETPFTNEERHVRRIKKF
jgi:ribose 5-phosphate isomerase B